MYKHLLDKTFHASVILRKVLKPPLVMNVWKVIKYKVIDLLVDFLDQWFFALNFNE
jgi:hypothetical protein